jgi:hypothetical protein
MIVIFYIKVLIFCEVKDLKKPKFAEKIKNEAVVASFLLVFLIAAVWYSFQAMKVLLMSQQFLLVQWLKVLHSLEMKLLQLKDLHTPQAHNLEGYWYLVKIPGKILTSISGHYRNPSELSGAVVKCC